MDGRRGHRGDRVPSRGLGVGKFGPDLAAREADVDLKRKAVLLGEEQSASWAEARLASMPPDVIADIA